VVGGHPHPWAPTRVWTPFIQCDEKPTRSMGACAWPPSALNVCSSGFGAFMGVCDDNSTLSGIRSFSVNAAYERRHRAGSRPIDDRSSSDP